MTLDGTRLEAPGSSDAGRTLDGTTLGEPAMLEIDAIGWESPGSPEVGNTPVGETPEEPTMPEVGRDGSNVGRAPGGSILYEPARSELGSTPRDGRFPDELWGPLGRMPLDPWPPIGTP